MRRSLHGVRAAARWCSSSSVPPRGPPTLEEISAAVSASPALASAVLETVDNATRTAIVATYIGKMDKAELFDALDVNKDGVVSQDEFLSWHGRLSASAGIVANASGSGADPVAWGQLRSIAMISAIPMVAFGFADNLIMVIAGDAIDKTLGIAFGFTAMAAAGLGNTFSDVVGVFLSGRIEALSGGFIRAPRLTRAQAASSLVKRTMAGSSAFGIAFGCLLGMFPLLFIDSKRTEDTKSLKQVFDLADTDGDASLSLAELTSVLRALRIQLDPAATREIFQSADADNNGTISFPEFAAAARGFLEHVDLNDDGTVSTDETIALLKKRMGSAVKSREEKKK